MTTNCKVRVAFLNTHPIQYFAPLYAYLNASEDLEVSAIYLSDYSIRGSHDAAFGQSVKWDIDLLAGYEAHLVKGFESRNEMRGFLSAIVPGLWHDLRIHLRQLDSLAADAGRGKDDQTNCPNPSIREVAAR